MPYDNLCKYLRQNFPDDFSLWLLGQTFTFAEIQPSELIADPIRADSVVLESSTLVLHLEFQTSPSPDMPLRMADYALRLQRRYPNPEIQIRQIVIYLRQTGSRLVQQTRYERDSMVHEFEVVRLWEQDPDQLVQLTGLLPFVVLSDPDNAEARLRQVARRIEQIPDPDMKANIAAATAVLSGVALNKSLVKSILGEMTMRDSAIYQEWRQEALAEGRLEGIKIGAQQSKQQTARNLLAIGLEPQQIAAATGLTLEQVQQLQLELDI